MANVVDTLITRFQMDDSGYVRGSQRVTQSTRQMVDVMGTASGSTGGISGFTSAIKLAVSELDSSVPVLGEVLSVIKFLGIAAVGAGVAIAGFSAYAMDAAADMQALELAVRQYAGSNEEAERTLRRLVDVAKLPGLGLPEAIKASTRLQAVGFDARLAERAILGFGNALAAAGGGKEELDGVILALTQIASKGVISAEEINQMAERVPQIRKILLDAFGTASTEAIQKMGITSQEAILKIIAGVEKLEKVTGGWKNSFANVGDVWTRVISGIGAVLNTVLVPALNQVTVFVENMVDGGFFTRLAEDFVQSASSVTFLADALRMVSDIGSSAGISALTDVFKFITDADSLGDGLVRVVSVIAAVVMNLPGVIGAVVQIINSQMKQIRAFVNGIIDALNMVLGQIAKGVKVKWPFGLPLGQVGGGGSFTAIGKVGEGGGVDMSPMNAPLNGIAAQADAIYEKYKKGRPSSIDGDTSKGGFRPGYEAPGSPIKDIEENTRRTAVASEKALQRFESAVFGGSELGKMGVTAREVGSIRKGSPGGGGSGLEAQIRAGVDMIIEGVLAHSATTMQAQARFSR